LKGALTRLALPAGLAVAFAAQISLFSSLAGQGVPAAVFPFAVGVAVMLGAPVSGFDELRGLAALGVRDLALAALAGALGLFLAPYLVASHRYSDAPPGTELIFFAGVLWGACMVVYAAGVLWRGGRRRGSVSALCGALAAVTGAAGILGNWERPSSFSPLVRFAVESGWMLVGGVAFIVGGLLLARLARTHGSARPVLVSGASAALCGVVAYLVTGAASQTSGLAERYAPLALWAAAAGVVWLLVAEALRSRREVAVGASFMVAPALISLLIFVERLVGVAGPDPLVWGGVAGGVALTAAGVAVLARVRVVDDAEVHPARWLPWTAGALCLAAAAGLFLPTISAAVSADRGGAALDVNWALLGWETVSGWVAVSCAALLLASAVDGARWSAAVALVLSPTAYVALGSTPYHVLTRWLPSEVQVDFGTEYASIGFKALTVWPARVAVVGAALGLVVVLSGRAMCPASPAAAVPPKTEE
jgi:hypothetical protein